MVNQSAKIRQHFGKMISKYQIMNMKLTCFTESVEQLGDTGWEA